jgi:hypothetical protein
MLADRYLADRGSVRRPSHATSGCHASILNYYVPTHKYLRHDPDTLRKGLSSNTVALTDLMSHLATFRRRHT